jgi:hypothetical protein
VINNYIVGIYLSERFIGDSNSRSAEPKLQCFIHHNKKIWCVKFFNQDENNNIIILSVIEEKEYGSEDSKVNLIIT